MEITLAAFKKLEEDLGQFPEPLALNIELVVLKNKMAQAVCRMITRTTH